MERTTKELIELVEDKFYVAYLTLEQYTKIPSTEGVEFYEYPPFLIPKSLYTVYYSKEKLLNYKKDYDEEDEHYILVGSPDIEPEFFIKNIELEE